MPSVPIPGKVLKVAAAAAVVAVLALVFWLGFHRPASPRAGEAPLSGSGAQSAPPAEGGASPGDPSARMEPGLGPRAPGGPGDPVPAPRPGTPAAGTETAFLGRVVDEARQPVGKALVEVTRVFALDRDDFLIPREVYGKAAMPEDLVASTRSDEKGIFSFPRGEIAGGPFWIRASASGYAAGRILVTGGRVSGRKEGDPVEVTLESAGTLMGTVRNRDGGGIEGALVTALTDLLVKDGLLCVTRSFARSDATGRFAFSDLPRSECVLVATKQGFPMGFREKVAVPGEGVVVEMGQGFLVRGRVLDSATGSGIPGARVVAWREAEGERDVWRGECGEQGGFLIDGLPPGRYRLAASAKRYHDSTAEIVEARAGDRLDREFRLRPGIALAGVALAAGSLVPLEGVEIRTEGESRILGGAPAEAGARTGPGGEFTLEGAIPQDEVLEEGESQVHTGKRIVTLGAQKRGWIQERPMRVEVPEGELRLRDVVVLLEKAPLASGRVVDGSGAPVPGARVSSYSGSYGIAGPSCEADERGAFELPLPPETNVWLVARVQGAAFGLQAVGDLRPGDRAEGLEIRLSRGGAVEGTATDEKGNPVHGEAIYCGYMGDREGSFRARLNSCGSEEHEGAPDSVTDENGRFAVRGLRAGLWQVAARSQKFLRQGVEEGLTMIPGKAGEEVLVAEGGVATVRIQIRTWDSIEGVVEDETGRRLGGVSLGAACEGQEGLSGISESAKDGSFKFPKLGRGLYRITAFLYGYSPARLEGVHSGGPSVRIVLEKEEKKE